MAEDPDKAKHPTTNCATEDPSTRSDALKPCLHGRNSRNLIVCIDGTANQFGDMNTNVIELYNLILKEDQHKQRTWYNSGIGTYVRPSWKSFKFYRQVLSHNIDLAIAWNFERTILAAYRWLSDNYESGDCIYLFGFSRGAYQVRVLSAMIDKVGLIYKGNETQIPFAYELYSDPKSHLHTATQVGSSQIQDKNKATKAERFKKAFSYKDVTVHFVGAWDTVSSIGIARSKNMLPGTIDGMKHVCYFRHALALDERRVKFLPEYAYGGTSTPSVAKTIDNSGSPVDTEPPQKDNVPNGNADGPIDNNKPSLSNYSPPIDKEYTDDNRWAAKMKSTGRRPHTMEVWFAGTHSDIGGGNVLNAGMDRSRPPLRWMVFEAGALGLRTSPFGRELSRNEQIEIKESLTLSWWLLELLPFERLTYTRQEKEKINTRKPHLGSSRKIHTGQKIHSSFVLSDNRQYTPKARPPVDKPNFWKDVLGDWLVNDLYEHTKILVEKHISEGTGSALQSLRDIAMSADGRQAVYEATIEALEKHEPAENHQLLHSAMDILGKRVKDGTSLKLIRSIEILPLLSNLLESHIEKSVVRQFLLEFMDCCLCVCYGHTDSVTSVAFSKLERVVSGSFDNTVRIWDAETGKQVGELFQGHRDVFSVAFSPDGRRVVSGLSDGTVRTRDTESEEQAGVPFRGHTDVVGSLAFSPDGSRVVSGSDDRTVRIWDVQRGKQMGGSFRGHTNRVFSVAFSPDGNHIVSSSADNTVRIWDVQTRKQVGELFRGHTDVFSVAFSPDGRRVVAGSSDRTVRIWDTESEEQVGEPFRGHTNWVYSVAFSPDGRRVVSGSGDMTVRIWDVQTGEQVGESFRGHTNPVFSVAFSPDGKYIVSGSADNTVRIWDVKAAEIFSIL